MLVNVLEGVRTSQKQYQADVVVLAAALGIPELAQQLQLQVPLTVKPRTVTVITKPLKRFLKHIVVTGMVCMACCAMTVMMHWPCCSFAGLVEKGKDTREMTCCCNRALTEHHMFAAHTADDMHQHSQYTTMCLRV